MTLFKTTSRIALTIASLFGVVLPAAAQGPLTAGLPEGPPRVDVYQIGPIQLTPDFAIREIGVDDNVFAEAVDPKSDFIFTLSPGLAAYARSGLLQVVVAAASDVTYFKKYASERSVSRELRGRLDLLLSRFRPSIGAGLVDSRQRPSAEIDLRAERSEREVSATLAFEASPLMRLYAGGARFDTSYGDDEAFRGVPLDDVLNRRGEQVQGGVRFALTPFTTLVVEGQTARDTFLAAPDRDSSSRLASMALTFSSDAIIQGTVRVGYRDFQPVNDRLSGYRGLVSLVNLTYTAFWRGRLALALERDVQYSFDEAEGYFVGTAADLRYTQRILGPIDALLHVGRGSLDYGQAQDLPDRSDNTTTFGGGLGYNQENGARLGFTYEHAKRDSALADRRYTRRRIFGSLTYRF
jgi:hypothetical protein